MSTPTESSELTTQMVAAALGISRNTALCYIWRGMIAARKAGRFHIVTAEALDAFKATYPHLVKRAA
jgi:hypothetical protein